MKSGWKISGEAAWQNAGPGKKISNHFPAQEGATQDLVSDFDGRDHPNTFAVRPLEGEQDFALFNLQVGYPASEFKQEFAGEKTARTEFRSVENDEHICLVNMDYGSYTFNADVTPAYGHAGRGLAAPTLHAKHITPGHELTATQVCHTLCNSFTRCWFDQLSFTTWAMKGNQLLQKTLR